MTYPVPTVTVQRPGRPVDPNEINARIEEAISRALSQQGQGSNQNAGEAIREAIEEVKAEIAQARAEGIREIRVSPQFGDNVIPSGAVDISVAFFVAMAFIIVGLPLARAFARRMDRRGASASASEIMPRLDRIEQAVEAIAIEVERVSEGQRYTTRAIADLRGLPGANPAGWPSGVRDGQAERVPAGERRP
ncbi:MAG: hypothetical protein ACREBP_05975 [Sphingomicrobium sp.]